ncbi:MAG: HAD-IC family P-type ATPase, partial [Clostridia bacterium]|nr:HAD-IC family P-type ATPase [Clostridia bacterium]
MPDIPEQGLCFLYFQERSGRKLKEYLMSTQEAVQSLSSAEEGLTRAEAAARLEKCGANKLREAKKPSLLSRFLRELADPMILILLAAALVSGVTAAYAGEGMTDTVIILAVVVINAVLGVAQESKAERAIEALQAIAAATSKVVRDGHVAVVKSEELVPGDIVLLEAGDSVPADLRILESASLKIEEAALTGESVPVSKTAEALKTGNGDVPLGDRVNMAYMGSTVVYGRGRALVTATGMDTEMGKIADALESAAEGETPLQKKLGQLSRVLSVLVLGICLAIFAVDVLRVYPNITGRGLLDTFMIAVSLAVAAIPEGLAAVVTIVLSMGVTKMSRRNAVIRRLTAVETLGCTQVICTDKT